MEHIDLYDEHRQRSGQTIVRSTAIPDGYYTLKVHALIFNSSGKLLIQKRSPNKQWHPNLWDISCSGAPIAGETSQAGMRREIFEELSLDMDLDRIRPVLTANFPNGFSDYYIIYLPVAHHQTIDYNRTEIQSIRWVSMSTVFNMIDTKRFVPYKKQFLQALLVCHHDFTEIDNF